MKKTPSYLKGLAETRARAAGDVQRFKRIYEEIGQKLAKAECHLAACDLLIQRFDERLDPGLIQPIHAWQGRYGKRGALVQEVRNIIKSVWPDEITTTEIVWRVQIKFQFDFVTWSEKKHWQDNTLRGTIKALLAKGEIERVHDVSNGLTGAVGRWRWKSDAFSSLEQLQAEAMFAGIAVQQADELSD